MKKFIVTKIKRKQRSIDKDLYKHIDMEEDSDINKKQVSFLEEDVTRRKPRRHTTGGTPQNLEAIQAARQLLESSRTQDDQESTLDRKQLITMLKERYGNKLYKNKQPGMMSHESSTISHNKSFETMNGNGVHPGSRDDSGESYESLRSRESRGAIGGQGHRRIIREQIETTTVTKIPPPKPVQNGYSETTETIKVTENQTGSNQQDCIFLQYRDEVHKVTMPTRISSIQTLQALFVTSFPRKISLVSFEEQNRPIYIKDATQDLFYELEDLSELKPRCLLKIHERVNSHETLDTLASHIKNEYYSYGQSWDSSSDYHMNNPSLRTRTLPLKKGPKQGYAASLQDYKIPSNHLDRATSNKSLKSDSLLTNNEWRTNGTLPRRNNEGRKEYSETITTTKISNQNQTPIANNMIGQSRSRSRSFGELPSPSTTSRTEYVMKQEKVKSPTITRKRDVPQRVNNTATTTTTTVKSTGMASSAGVTPMSSKLHDMSIEEERVTTNIEEQLDDLTELLQSAIDDEPQKQRAKLPGKLNRHVIRQLEATQERGKSMGLQNRASFKATDIVMAKDEADRRSSDSLSSSNVTSSTSHAVQNEEEVFYPQAVSNDMKQPGLSSLLMRDQNAGQYGPTSTSVSKSTTYFSSAKTEPKKETITERHTQKKVVPTYSFNAKATPQKATVVIEKQDVKPTKDQPNPPVRISSKSIYIQSKLKPTIKQNSSNQGRRDVNKIRDSLAALRNELSMLRRDHDDNTQDFAVFFADKHREFHRLLPAFQEATRLVNNGFGGAANENPVRQQRMALDLEQSTYDRKCEIAENALSELEEETEMLRKDVVAKKTTVDANFINSLNTDLNGVTKAIAELQGRFSNIQSLLKIVMSGELEIIVREEKFLKGEPSILDKLHTRCRHLSGTLFTLQKLASVQNNNEGEENYLAKTDINGNINTTQKITVSSSFRQTSESKPTTQRTVRFVSQ